ncbi:MAG TPA: hypothetical protein VNT75_15535, partial [Symbiobacteriaceae bacterium]|nr:hypothetical protein [Symbiobacteriaceae bacterium]
RFAGTNHLQEGVPLRMFYCPECGKVEFFLQPAPPEEAVECLSCGKPIPPGRDNCEHCGWTYRQNE